MLVYVRDWLHHQLDRLAYWWLTRPLRQVEEYIRRKMAENAARSDGP